VIVVDNIDVDDSQALALGVRPGGYVALSVSDHGCGMMPDVKAKIFEPFFTTKAIGRGTGLGLSTVFGIVHQSDGAITVDTEPGRGTTFRVIFPRALSVGRRTPSSLVSSPLTRGGSETILVVEDDASLRSAIRRQLATWGYAMLEASDGAHALAVLRDCAHIDLVLTDLVMPGIDGCALAATISTTRPETKILLMSGYTEHPALNNPGDLVLSHFLQKPFTNSKLSEAIRRVLDT
jgi:two-component system, cell cycle sensor histidine kinase and response regulator CckA